jgi:hypothetical protein
MNVASASRASTKTRSPRSSGDSTSIVVAAASRIVCRCSGVAMTMTGSAAARPSAMKATARVRARVLVKSHRVNTTGAAQRICL